VSQVHSPIQYYSLFKAFMIIFVIQAIVFLLAPFIPVLFDTELRFLLLFINVVVSAMLGWPLYKRIYHMYFTYDNKGFALKKGKKKENSYKWNEFSKVSLIRTEYGDFSVRLYRNEEDFFDIPASKLKLNPSDFRFEAMQLVSAGKNEK